MVVQVLVNYSSAHQVVFKWITSWADKWMFIQLGCRSFRRQQQEKKKRNKRQRIRLSFLKIIVFIYSLLRKKNYFTIKKRLIAAVNHPSFGASVVHFLFATFDVKFRSVQYHWTKPLTHRINIRINLNSLIEIKDKININLNWKVATANISQCGFCIPSYLHVWLTVDIFMSGVTELVYVANYSNGEQSDRTKHFQQSSCWITSGNSLLMTI